MDLGLRNAEAGRHHGIEERAKQETVPTNLEKLGWDDWERFSEGWWYVSRIQEHKIEIFNQRTNFGLRDDVQGFGSAETGGGAGCQGIRRYWRLYNTRCPGRGEQRGGFGNRSGDVRG